MNEPARRAERPESDGVISIEQAKRGKGGRQRPRNGAGSTLVDGDPLPEHVQPHTDLGNAHRLRRDHGDDLRHVRSLGWLVHDGTRFEVDQLGGAERRVHEVACGMLERAGKLLIAASAAETNEERNRLTKAGSAMAGWARKSQDGPRIKLALSVASSLDGIASAVDAFDRNPMLLNVRNGTVDLETGQLRPHRREDTLTRRADVVFDPDAKAPVFEAFVHEIFAGDEELVRFVQLAAGYSLTGSNVEQCFFVGHGLGANGKSTLLEAWRRVLGDYATNTPTDTFLRARDGRGAENDIARLRGARFVSAVESGEGRRLDEERIKRLTGGDTVTARFLYREHFEFVPVCKVWLAVNDRPEIAGVDHGIWRRVRLIPFDVTIPAHKQDRELGSKLASEGPGILRWMLDGCLAWQKEGLGKSKGIDNATAEWRADANVVAAFVDECCVTAEGLSAKGSALFGAFTEWSREQGNEPLSGKAFAARLRALEFKSARTKSARVWRGLGLRTGESQEG